MTAPQFVDISGAQGVINFAALRAWAAQWDGVARLAIKVTEGVGYTDPWFAGYRAQALAAGFDSIMYYHYGRPGLGNQAAAEADWFRRVVGDIRPLDTIALDLEEDSDHATAAWAYAFLQRAEQNYAGNLPRFYSYNAYILERMQDIRLAHYPLWLALWTYNPDARPACPPPWSSYVCLQYSNNSLSIPGIAEKVDVNVSLIQQGEQHSMLDISQVANFFEATNDPRRWHCKDAAHNFDIAYAILDFYRQENGLTRYGLPCSGEISLRKGNAVIQRFERGSIIYDPDRQVDTPPGAVGPCYAAHIDGFYDMADKLDVANATIADLRALLAADKSTETDLHTQISELTQQLTDEKAAESELQTKISALQDQLSNAAPIDKQAVSALLQALQPYATLFEQLKKVA